MLKGRLTAKCEKLFIEPKSGEVFEILAFAAYNLCRERKCIVEFIFNDTVCTFDTARPDPEW